ncbi:hypothetical protein A3H85_02360 [Candidatus Daviesbacteria bacterium RIFCSPLOWO2_02_FULL_40_8]|uniref:DUF5673 domain-containing protein n=1 Tax=Candidatus Daviesbacteria bacterium RIFCSPLOWO2_01_FULL_40_24 TaxID=1797787 RepID=A0A1F5MKG1_9BACT|nr:MAG: hypothetical protein A2780_00080 [Candidatus Daviesbacteria bacterium RIFCSPHIGHO2_01_FULL_41_45]OGE65876.1 MAG: hypothetical protein A3B49_03735 [Candidatus Daviesbacteria bacterium RIFCSPLOWO2_01_FULL_40_24]OGE66722.1 MAG: hypothetical protein A3H85_02360 [Candidatus Daviesbacteria bacterium RIFCSPLOWO2_02_FULL_40_8]
MPKFFVKPILDPTHELPAHEALPPHEHQAEVDDSPDPVRTLLSWRAPSRPFRSKDKTYYTTIAIIVVLLILIALLIQEFILVGVLLAIAFVAYVLGFVSPDEIEYRVSTQGITIGDHFYFWDWLDSFWFSEKDGARVLNVLTHLRLPGMLLVVLGETDQEGVKRVVARYLPYHEIAPKTMMDKWATSLQKFFPLEAKRL